MSDPRTTSEHEAQDEQGSPQGGTVSEAGSSSLSPDTALGGADSVPDTPDVNDAPEDRAADLNVADEHPVELPGAAGAE